MNDETKEAGLQDLWAIVEVMGHSQYAGRVSEYTGLGGKPARPASRVMVSGESGPRMG